MEAFEDSSMDGYRHSPVGPLVRMFRIYGYQNFGKCVSAVPLYGEKHPNADLFVKRVHIESVDAISAIATIHYGQ